MKRKIPFINSHIFRQPDIPWGSGAFDPFSLNPDLFLDARDVDYLTLNILGAQVIGDQSATGADFTQVVVANQGQVDSATVTTQIEYDGVSDYSENTLDVAKFAAMSQGSVVQICSETANDYSFTMGDSSTTTDWLYMGITSLLKPIIVVRISGVTLNNQSINPINIGDTYEWKKKNGLIKLLINGLEVDHTENHNSWFSDLNNIDNIRIGSVSRLTPLYTDLIFKHLSIFSTPLTDAQSLQYANYLIEKHNL